MNDLQIYNSSCSSNNSLLIVVVRSVGGFSYSANLQALKKEHDKEPY